MLKNSFLSKIEKEAIAEFKKLLAEKLKREVLAVQLFGSKARGDFNKDSDIDLIIILENADEENKDKVFDAVMAIIDRYELYLSVHIYSKKEYDYLNSIPTVFMQIIHKEAVAL